MVASTSVSMHDVAFTAANQTIAQHPVPAGVALFFASAFTGMTGDLLAFYEPSSPIAASTACRTAGGCSSSARTIACNVPRRL